jgi:hypothetical protein
MRTTRAATLLLLAVVGVGVSNCSSKVAVVCDKLEGCGLIERTYAECVDVVETAFADDRIEDEALSKCVDCLSFNFCSAIEDGACGDLSKKGEGEPGVCGDVVRQIREYYGDGGDG